MNYCLVPIKLVSEHFSGTMATKKVEALEEKLESEIGAMKTAVESEIGAVKTAVEELAVTLNERLNQFQERFSSLESMLTIDGGKA